ncbi:MAG: HAD family hydrolase [Proteobacteria bacterium]|nr:HAD family hydrolase [Pseudomonadota bacterium]
MSPSAPLPRAVFFDLDDTILSFSAGADECWARVCARHVGRLPGIDTPALRAAIDESRDWFWSDDERSRAGRLDMGRARRRIVGRAFDELGLDAETVALELADQFTLEREERVHLFPGALETLVALRDRGVPLALLTNGGARFQRAKIDRFELASHFEIVLIEEEFGVGKPDERVFRRALDHLGVAPGETWMVGDSLRADIAPAVALGLHSVWVDHRDAGLPEDAPASPHRRVVRISELLV